MHSRARKETYIWFSNQEIREHFLKGMKGNEYERINEAN